MPNRKTLSNTLTKSKETIRQNAEKMVQADIDERLKNDNPLSSSEMVRIFHELQVHQIELEMQNEELIQTQEELNAAKLRYFDLYNMAPVGYCSLDDKGIIIEANLTVSKLLGVERNELITMPITHFILPHNQDNYYLFRKKFSQEEETTHSCELRMVKKDGTPFWAQLTVSTSVDNSNSSYLRLIISDITIAKEREEELASLAHFDTLTGLPNRVLLSDRLEQAMIHSRRYNQFLVVVFLDLDGFKAVNDNHGHAIGDQLLISLSNNMQEALREGDTLSRIGGDEFVVILPDLLEIEDAIVLLDRLLSVVSMKVQIGNLSVQVSASLGVTIFPQPENVVSADQLLRQADQAMYEAKLSGKNHYEFFNLEQTSTIRMHQEAMENIKKALHNEDFVLFYQPKVNMRTGVIIGMEALIRWENPEKGLIPPLKFLPTIEGNSLSIELGEWVINTALKQIEHWQNDGIDIPVSINISAYHLMSGNFAERLSVILSKYPNVKPSSLEIEISESSKVEDIIPISEIIVTCRDLGVKFVLDDFGTKCSSLTYLQQLPIKLIKIDQSFVKGMLGNSKDLAILEGVIGLAGALGHDVIAEGVETFEHGVVLLQLGCELAQGYAIARPMPAKEVQSWMDKWASLKIWSK